MISRKTYSRLLTVGLCAMLLSLLMVGTAFAGTSIAVTAAGGSGGDGSSGGGMTGGEYNVWGYHPTSGMSAWVGGNNVKTLDPNYSTISGSGFNWGGIITGGVKQSPSMVRTSIAIAGAQATFWYQVYVVQPSVNDKMAAGGANFITSYSPRWGRADVYADAEYWTTGGYGRFDIDNGTTPDSGAMKGLKLTAFGTDNYDHGGQRPPWNSTYNGSWNYPVSDNTISGQPANGSIVSDSGYCTVTGSSAISSSIKVNLGTLVNNPLQKEGRYAIFGFAARGRGQIMNSAYTAYKGKAATRFKLIRPRVRVNVVDRATGQPIPGATYTLSYKGSAKASSVPAGEMRGSAGYASVNSGSSFAQVQQAAFTNSTGAAADVGTKVLPTSFAAADYSVELKVSSDYTFDQFVNADAAWSKVEFYAMKQVDKNITAAASDPISGMAEFRTPLSGTVSGTDGNTLNLSNLDIGRFDLTGEGLNGGLYEVTIYAQSKGISVNGNVYNDMDTDGANDAGDTPSRYPHEIVFVPRGLDPTSSGNYIEYDGNATIADAGGNYSKMFSTAQDGVAVDEYIKVYNPHSTPALPTYFGINDHISPTMPGFRITEPALKAGAPAGSDDVAYYHVAQLTLNNDKVQNIGLFYGAPNKNPTPLAVVTAIEAPPNWLNSNRSTTITYNPKTPDVAPVVGKIISISLVHAELFYPANTDWAYYRVKTGSDSAQGRNIQPAYISVAGSPIIINGQWRQENASVTSNQLTIVTPSGVISPAQWANLYNGTRFKYVTIHTSADTDLEIQGTTEAKTTVMTGWNGSYGTFGEVAGLMGNPNYYMVGSTPQNGGTTYYGIAAYYVEERDASNRAIILNSYYEFANVAKQTIRVYNSVGTN